jgi:hypothetical protein
MKLSNALNVNQNIRIRSFTLGGQNFRVRVPLASEMEEISKVVAAVNSEAKFSEMSKPLRELDDKEKIEITDDDVIVDGKSIKELAQLTVQTEERILQLIRLLVPAQEGFNMNEISYEDVNAEFPFAVQLELMRKIAEVISPGYEETRKN